MGSEADAQACLNWDEGLHAGYDDKARPLSTTWEAFTRLLLQDLGDASTVLIYLAACAAPFLPLGLGTPFAPERAVGGSWIGLGILVLLAEALRAIRPRRMTATGK